MLMKDFLSLEIHLREESVYRNPGITSIEKGWEALSAEIGSLNSSAGMLLLTNPCWRPIYAAN